jgi:hypothetical protein
VRDVRRQNQIYDAVKSSGVGGFWVVGGQTIKGVLRVGWRAGRGEPGGGV